MNRAIRDIDYHYMLIAQHEARESWRCGGIPIGTCLVVGDQVVAKGYNQRVQKNNDRLHAEVICLQRAQHLTKEDFQHATLYSTLSPSGLSVRAILLAKIPRVVVAENISYYGAEQRLARGGVDLINLNLPESIAFLGQFIETFPSLWRDSMAVA